MKKLPVYKSERMPIFLNQNIFLRQLFFRYSNKYTLSQFDTDLWR